MAHFAEVDENNVVTRVLVVGDDQEHRGHEFLANDLGLGGTWVKTSYNTQAGQHLAGGTPFRYNYAGVGYTWDPNFGEDGAFIPPKPFPSWILNSTGAIWDPPVAYPSDGKYYIWNEENQSWDEVVEE
jgi:hypothetical protein